MDTIQECIQAGFAVILALLTGLMLVLVI